MFEFDSDDLDWVLGELRTAVESAADAKQLLIDHAPELVAASLRFFVQWHEERRRTRCNQANTPLPVGSQTATPYAPTNTE